MQIDEDKICKTCYGSGGDIISFDPITIGQSCPDCLGTGKINTSVLFTK